MSERIDVLGVNDFTFALTAHARARGRDAASGAGVVSVKEGQFGRGERDCADTPSPSLIIPVTNVPSYVYRASKTA